MTIATTDNIRWKFIPYILIVIFSVVVTVIRIFMITEWGMPMQLLVFILQVIYLSGIWILIKTLSTYLDTIIPFEKNIVKRIAIQVATALVLDFPIYILLFMDNRPFGLNFLTTQFLAIISLLIFIFILFMNIGYDAFYFFKQWQTSVREKAKLQVQAAELKMDKSMMQYHHLKNQVNPHFLFNNLTSLDGLIQTNPDLASDFVRHLSKVYRYVLEHKENEVVSLETEVDFIQHYISLLELRYKNVLQISTNISKSAFEKGIVMVTLQMLIDNAIKHNSLEADAPLKISVWDENGNLHVKNNKQLRRQIETSNKHGLQQLKDLYSYLSEQKIVVDETIESFTIILPLL
ncbi:MAG: histidine kinase [Ginsengibacter sp.]